MLFMRVSESATHDAAVRAEMRRVGFRRACTLLGTTRRELTERHQARFAPVAVAAIRRLVPAERLSQVRILSFAASPLIVYKARVQAAVDRDAADVIAAAMAEMRATYMTRLRELGTDTAPDANLIMPSEFIARALGIEGAWDLDRPTHVAMACNEQLYPAEQRPAISGGGPAGDNTRRN